MLEVQKGFYYVYISILSLPCYLFVLYFSFPIVMELTPNTMPPLVTMSDLWSSRTKLLFFQLYMNIYSIIEFYTIRLDYIIRLFSLPKQNCNTLFLLFYNTILFYFHSLSSLCCSINLNKLLII